VAVVPGDMREPGDILGSLDLRALIDLHQPLVSCWPRSSTSPLPTRPTRSSPRSPTPWPRVVI
jgi:hypothetical protein